MVGSNFYTQCLHLLLEAVLLDMFLDSSGVTRFTRPSAKGTSAGYFIGRHRLARHCHLVCNAFCVDDLPSTEYINAMDEYNTQPVSFKKSF